WLTSRWKTRVTSEWKSTLPHILSRQKTPHPAKSENTRDCGSAAFAWQSQSAWRVNNHAQIQGQKMKGSKSRESSDPKQSPPIQ
ncbi:hypothetical protein, partial [uncultured Sulfitobacter sp.]|uniref:hypothetical protein n=1 Tax=uncultured Sulfitobacter sp. TaxID=191468 RepID=UPI0030D78A11